MTKPKDVDRASVQSIVRRPFFDGFFRGACLAGVLGIIGCRVYQIVWHPEWTEAQAIRELWTVYAIAIANIVFGLLWFRD